jgi:predicted Abi (CAAX) family protease
MDWHLFQSIVVFGEAVAFSLALRLGVTDWTERHMDLVSQLNMV